MVVVAHVDVINSTFRGHFDFGNFCFYCACQGTRGEPTHLFLIVADAFAQDAVDVFWLWMEAVIAVFVVDDREGDDAARNANGQPKEVDEGVAFLAQEVADRDGEVVE